MSEASVGKEMGAVCSHGDTDGLLTNVPSEFDIYVLSIRRFSTMMPPFICVALFAFSFGHIN